MEHSINKKIGFVFLGLLILSVIVFIYYRFNPSSTNTSFLACPIKMVTGYHCPGCGSQRAIHQLLHLNVYRAFRLNPFMLASLPIIMYALGLRLYNYLFNTQHRVGIFYSKWFIYGYFGLALLYWLLRNLPYYPFNLLAPTS